MEEDGWNKKMPWSNDSIQLLLKLWEEHEELYNIKHQHYQNKHRRWAALRNIASKLSTLRPHTSPDDIKHKMNIIRTQYGSDLKRFLTEENRQPTIWWFELAGFLNKYIKHRREGGSKVGGTKKEITNEEFIQHYQKPEQHQNAPPTQHIQQQYNSPLQHTNPQQSQLQHSQTHLVIPSHTQPQQSSQFHHFPLPLPISNVSNENQHRKNENIIKNELEIIAYKQPTSQSHITPTTTTISQTATNTATQSQIKHQPKLSISSTVQLKRKFEENHLKNFHHLVQKKSQTNSKNANNQSNASTSSSPQVQKQFKCDDEYDIVGRNVALKLNNMKTRQKVFAEKLISDILYYGQLDLLNLTTAIIIGNDMEEDGDSNDTDPLNFVDVTTDGPADSTK